MWRFVARCGAESGVEERLGQKLKGKRRGRLPSLKFVLRGRVLGLGRKRQVVAGLGRVGLVRKERGVLAAVLGAAWLVRDSGDGIWASLF